MRRCGRCWPLFFNYISHHRLDRCGIPAILLSLLMQDPMTAGLVALFYTVINTLLGSIIEPRLMGNLAGHLAFGGILSLMFWGWL